jgi:diacylglycerol kinase (ATP)
LATLLEIPRLRALPLTLELDGQNHRFDISLLAIANTAYFGGGMAICPDADPADGQLDVAIVSAVGRATLLRFFPQVFKGTHVSHPAVTMLRGRRLTLTTDPSTQLWGDGELVGPLPIDVEVIDDALHIAGGRHVAGGRRNP